MFYVRLIASLVSLAGTELLPPMTKIVVISTMRWHRSDATTYLSCVRNCHSQLKYLRLVSNFNLSAISFSSLAATLVVGLVGELEAWGSALICSTLVCTLVQDAGGEASPWLLTPSANPQS
jgi:hypothetical protein